MTNKIAMIEEIEKIEVLAMKASNADSELALAPSLGNVFGTDLPPHQHFINQSQAAWNEFDSAINRLKDLVAAC